MKLVEAKSSINPLREIMWTALGMAMFAFFTGMYLSGPAWEQRDGFHRKWDFVSAAFWAIITIIQALKLSRQLKKTFASIN